MIPRRVWLVLLSILVLLTGLSARPLQAQGGNERYFERTQHYVRGEFLVFYDSIANAELLLGAPITEAGKDRFRDNVTVQYFEKGRLELDITGKPGERVSIADLGRLLFDETQRGVPQDYSANANNRCRLFPETGKNVCYEFRNFYDAHEGVKYFGLPISDTELLDGRLVQYFERARLEWQPERAVGQRVVLTPLGLIYVEKIEGIRSSIIDAPGDLDVTVFVDDALLGSDEQQTVFIRVTRNGQPVSNLTPIVHVLYPDLSEQNLRPSLKTDQDGLTSATFPLSQSVQPNRVVNIRVEVLTSEGSTGEAFTWFRTWW